MIKRRIFTKLRFQFGRHFFNKMAVPYLLSGIFPKFWFRRRKRNRFLPKRVSSAVMFSIFGSGSCEEVHYCGKWFSCDDGDTAFSQKKFWSSSGRKKQVDFSQRLGKTSRFFFRCLQKQIGVFKMAERNIIMSFSSRCVEVVHRRLWSGILNPPDDFSVVLLEDVIVEDWGGFTNSSPREGPGSCYCDWILTIGEGKMLERRRRSSSSGWDVVAALLHSRVGWISYPDGVE